jgi:hypothetical protein
MHRDHDMSSYFIQQRLGLLEVCRVKPLSELGIDLSQQPSSCVALALAMPQATQAQRCPKLQGLCWLPPGNFEGLKKTGLRFNA